MPPWPISLTCFSKIRETMISSWNEQAEYAQFCNDEHIPTYSTLQDWFEVELRCQKQNDCNQQCDEGCFSRTSILVSSVIVPLMPSFADSKSALLLVISSLTMCRRRDCSSITFSASTRAFRSRATFRFKRSIFLWRVLSPVKSCFLASSLRSMMLQSFTAECR